jgi:hypothetical protein
MQAFRRDVHGDQRGGVAEFLFCCCLNDAGEGGRRCSRRMIGHDFQLGWFDFGPFRPLLHVRRKVLNRIHVTTQYQIFPKIRSTKKMDKFIFGSPH